MPELNGLIERLEKTCLTPIYLIQEVNALAFEWQVEYNKNHPHKSLNGQSPWLFTGQTLVDEINY